MKRFTIVSRDDRNSSRVQKKLYELLIQEGWTYDIERPELVFCVGGDGTLLHGVHQWLSQSDQLSFIGIHTGNLGFYTDYLAGDLPELIHDLKTKTAHVEKVPLLSAQLENGSVLYALNEIRLESLTKTQTIDVYLNHAFFETIRGNGLCVCGQYGSTAYNRSAGGAVLFKGMNAMELIELNGIHHNRSRSLVNPIVLNADQIIECRSQERFHEALIVYDHKSRPLGENGLVRIALGEKTVSFLHLREVSFVDRIKALI